MKIRSKGRGLLARLSRGDDTTRQHGGTVRTHYDI